MITTLRSPLTAVKGTLNIRITLVTLSMEGIIAEDIPIIASTGMIRVYAGYTRSLFVKKGSGGHESHT